MKKETEQDAPKLQCPQCHELAAATEKNCPACGADMYVDCPDCGLRRGPEDAFCRKCGFNFRRKKLHLKEAAGVTTVDSQDTLPQIGFVKSGRRYKYRMNPRMAAFRAFFMFLLLLLIAATLILIVNKDWGNEVLKLIREQYQVVSTNAAVAATPVEPDWKARYQYWLGYYRDVFSLPATNTQVTLGLTTGVKEQCLFVKVADGCVVVLKDGAENEYPRLGLNEETCRTFFREDYAAAQAKAKVKLEMAEWSNKTNQPGGGPGSNISSGLPVPPSAGGTSAPPVLTHYIIKCPACAGMGYLVVKESGRRPGSGGLDSGGGFGSVAPKPPASQPGRQQCPVCGGKGFRRFEYAPDFPWPAGASRCGNCQGMGALLVKSAQGLNQGIRCKICEGRGYVVNQFDAAKNVPLKYE